MDRQRQRPSKEGQRGSSAIPTYLLGVANTSSHRGCMFYAQCSFWWFCWRTFFGRTYPPVVVAQQPRMVHRLHWGQHLYVVCCDQVAGIAWRYRGLDQDSFDIDVSFKCCSILNYLRPRAPSREGRSELRSTKGLKMALATMRI